MCLAQLRLLKQPQGREAPRQPPELSAEALAVLLVLESRSGRRGRRPGRLRPRQRRGRGRGRSSGGRRREGGEVACRKRRHGPVVVEADARRSAGPGRGGPAGRVPGRRGESAEAREAALGVASAGRSNCQRRRRARGVVEAEVRPSSGAPGCCLCRAGAGGRAEDAALFKQRRRRRGLGGATRRRGGGPGRGLREGSPSSSSEVALRGRRGRGAARGRAVEVEVAEGLASRNTTAARGAPAGGCRLRGACAEVPEVVVVIEGGEAPTGGSRGW
mmetsp:Transcript_27734/g.92179  ORF Transcript_27734/g.92179 Transcript_27734/m.92179 type:complete len:274 (-) Transcript_27734:679-1500(-)